MTGFESLTKVRCAVLLACVVALAAAPGARAQTPEEWVALGTRVHGGFGAFIPVGIRIGLDALQRLGAKPRDVEVLYYDSINAPCACIADGVAIATLASIGQRSLIMSPDQAPAGELAVIVIRRKETSAAFTYTVSDEWLLKLAAMNKTLDALARFHAVMKAEGLFQVKARPDE